MWDFLFNIIILLCYIIFVGKKSASNSFAISVQEFLLVIVWYTAFWWWENLTISFHTLCFVSAHGLQCYQCDSNEDNSCPSNHRFDHNLNALVDCNSLEAHTPGTFCMKTTQQSPGCKFFLSSLNSFQLMGIFSQSENILSRWKDTWGMQMERDLRYDDKFNTTICSWSIIYYH